MTLLTHHLRQCHNVRTCCNEERLSIAVNRSGMGIRGLKNALLPFRRCIPGRARGRSMSGAAMAPTRWIELIAALVWGADIDRRWLYIAASHAHS